jgi:hypothetical protein
MTPSVPATELALYPDRKIPVAGLQKRQGLFHEFIAARQMRIGRRRRRLFTISKTHLIAGWLADGRCRKSVTFSALHF